MSNKITIKHGESVFYPREEMSKETIEALDDLKIKLAEQDMCLSIFQAINGISTDIYHVIKNDYRKAYNECTEAKNKISKIVMDKYQAEEGNLSWTYSSVDESLQIYLA